MRQKYSSVAFLKKKKKKGSIMIIFLFSVYKNKLLYTEKSVQNSNI